MTAVVCISFGHLYGYDAGLGEFCRRLGERMARLAPALAERGVRLCFHAQTRLHGSLGPHVDYIAYRRRQEFLPWSLPGCVLWHSLFQHDITRAPTGVRSRLLTVHDLNFRYVRRGIGSIRDELRTRIAVSRADHVVTISDYVGGDVRRYLGWRGPVETIYNGASDLSALAQEPVPSLIGHRFMFHISRMAPSKNVASIIELARSWPERIFVLAGPPWGHSKELHDSLGTSIPNLRILLGVSEAVKAWLLQHCEAFLFPSLTEGFGLPPIEAMYFGTPVFLSNRTCLPEIGGDVAGYFSEFSPAGMRAVLERELPPLEKRRADIRCHAESFDWDRCAARYLSLYDRLLTPLLGAGAVIGAQPSVDPSA